MADRLEELRTLLDELSAELREVETLDGPTRQAMEETASEMIAALHRSAEHDEVEQRGDESDETLRDRVVEFEASHPNLAAVFHRLIDILGQMGI